MQIPFFQRVKLSINHRFAYYNLFANYWYIQSPWSFLCHSWYRYHIYVPAHNLQCCPTHLHLTSYIACIIEYRCIPCWDISTGRNWHSSWWRHDMDPIPVTLYIYIYINGRFAYYMTTQRHVNNFRHWLHGNYITEIVTIYRCYQQ